MSAEVLSKIQADPTLNSLYHTLLSRLNLMGPLEVEIKRTSIHIVKNRAFLEVHPRQQALMLNIVLDRALGGHRVKKSEQVSKNRFHNEVLVSSPNDIDAELTEWMREAYELS